eukprot:scaffold5475_cov127-Isochrysis_galbana.AAC.5
MVFDCDASEYQCEALKIQLAPDPPSMMAWASGSVGPKPGSMGPIGQNDSHWEIQKWILTVPSPHPPPLGQIRATPADPRKI